MADDIVDAPPPGEEPVDVPLTVEDGSLSLAGRDLVVVPSEVAQQFGPQVITLNLSYNNLRTLANLDTFVNLDSLLVDNNSLENLSHFPKLEKLKTFSANNNSLSDIDGLLKAMKESVPNLQYLSLLKNPACPHALAGGDDEDYQRYRHRVIYNLPSLKFLDSKTVTAAERKEATRVGPFLKVAKPTDEQFEKQRKAKSIEEEEQPEYRPLPQDLTPMGEHTGTFGQSKYVYYGRHSEGNRFIRNNDL